MEFALMIAYVLTGIISVAFVGGWLFLDRSLSWTFFLALMTFIPTIYAMFVKDWFNYCLFGFCFLVLVHLYAFDVYVTKYQATRRGRR